MEGLRQTFNNFLLEIRKMARMRRGGTVVFNLECPPSEDVVLSFISRDSSRLDLPYQREILLRLFDTSRQGHDGAVFIHLYDEHTLECAPKIHSRQGRRAPLHCRHYQASYSLIVYEA